MAHTLLSVSEAIDTFATVLPTVASYFLLNLLEPGHTATNTPYEGGTLQALLSADELRGIPRAKLKEV